MKGVQIKDKRERKKVFSFSFFIQKALKQHNSKKNKTKQNKIKNNKLIHKQNHFNTYQLLYSVIRQVLRKISGEFPRCQSFLFTFQFIYSLSKMGVCWTGYSKILQGKIQSENIGRVEVPQISGEVKNYANSGR